MQTVTNNGNPYDGSQCPVCNSESVNAGESDAEGFDIIYRNCDCNDCGACWTEILKVVGYDNVVDPSAN